MYKPFFDLDFISTSNFLFDPLLPTQPQIDWVNSVSPLAFTKPETFGQDPGDTITLFMDDFGNTAGTAGTANVGGTTSGTIETATDTDWFEITVAEGETITVTDPSPGLIFRLMNGDGTVADTGTGFFDGNAFQDLSTGTYYIEVSATFSPAPYSLAVRTHTDDHGDDAANATPTTTSTSGVIEFGGDVDVFSISVGAGEVFELNYMMNPDVFINVTDLNGNTVAATNTLNAGIEDYHSFVNLTPGTYYIQAQGMGFGGFTPNYGFGAQTYVDDHQNDSMTTSQLLSADDTVSGSLQGALDEDWFEMSVTDGQTVRITPTGLGFDHNVKIVDASGTDLGAFDDPVTGELVFNPTSSGTVYVVVEHNEFSPGPRQNANYTLSTVVPDDFPDDVSTTGSLNIGGTTNGTFEVDGDADWFRVALAEGETLSVHGDVAQNFRLLNADGTVAQVAQIDNFSGLNRHIFDDMSAGTYYLEIVQAPGGAATGYTITSNAFFDDHGDEAATATDATVQSDGRFDSAVDQDWFFVDLAAGETLEIAYDVSLGNFDPGAPFSLRDAGGNIIHQDHGFLNFNGQDYFRYDDLGAGRVYIVGQNDGTRDGLNYDFDVNIFTDDHGSDAATASALAAESSVVGTIQGLSDFEWFEYTFEAGETVRFTVEGDEYISISVMDAMFNSFANGQPNFGQTTNFVEFTSDIAQTLYVRLFEFNYDVDNNYTLTAENVIPDVPGDPSSAAEIEAGETVDGIFDAAFDSDWYGFSATEGQILRFVLDANDINNTNMNLYDSNGFFVSVGPSFVIGDQRYFEFEVPADGDYFVSPTHFAATPEDQFTLTMTEIVDDYAGDATTEGVLLPGETIEGRLDFNLDRDWLRIDGNEGDVIRVHTITDAFFVNLFDTNGFIAQTSYSTPDGFFHDIVFRESGSFFLEISDNFGSVDVDFTVSASLIDDDFTDTSNTEGTIAAGETVSGNYDFIFDTDWFAFEAEAGQSILATLTDNGTLDGALGLTLYGSDGGFIQGVDGSFQDNEMSFTFDEGGTYYIGVFGSGLDFEGSYELSVDDISILGTPSSDFLLGTSGDDAIAGLGSSDHIRGFEGDDDIFGGAGIDLIEGGAGADNIDGGADFDYITFASSDAGVTVNLQTGMGSGGHAEGDTYANVPWVIGSAFDDTIIGGEGYNYFSAGAGADIMTGGPGMSDMFQRDDFDYLQVSGHMDGDIITDFGLNDQIRLIGSFYAGDIFPTFIGEDAFSSRAGEIRFERSGDDTLIQVDTDGDGSVDETLTLLDYDDILFMDFNMTIQGRQGRLGTEFADSLGGTNNADLLAGLAGDDFLYAFDGDDLIEGGEGNDFIDGGNGSDTALYTTATMGVTVDLNLNGIAQDTGGAGIDTLISIENVTGSDFNDILIGDGNDNILDGGLGDDLIAGRDGDDELIGGVGNDTVSYFFASGRVIVDLNVTAPQDTVSAGIDSISGFENVIGSQFADILIGDSGDNILLGFDGNDDFDGGLGDDTLDGGAGIDRVSYASATARVFVDLSVVGPQNTGGAGVDTLISIEQVEGSDFRDVLFGNSNGNVLLGGDGNDYIDGGGNANFMDGGAGTSDWVGYASSLFGVVIDLSNTGIQTTGDILINFENLDGSDFDDWLTGDAGSNFIYGHDGDDIVEGGMGNDQLFGGAGLDTASYANAAAGVIVDLSVSIRQDTVSAGLDTLTGFENLEGSQFDDILIGDANNNAIFGLDGDDLLIGGLGDNLLMGGLGQDDFFGGSGNDVMDGGLGIDRVNYASATSRVIVDLSDTNAQDTQGAGLDTLISIEQVVGTSFRDVLFGNGQGNYILGGAGNDYIDGGGNANFLDGGAGASDWVSFQRSTVGVTIDLSNGGVQVTGDIIQGFENLEGSDFNDVLTGDAGFNFVDGQDGDDVVNGGLGNDFLNGGSGSDTFLFEAGFGQDRVFDFVDGTDGLQFNVAGLTQFSQLSVTQSGANTIVSYDGNSITLVGVTATDITDADVSFVAPPPAEPSDDATVLAEKNTNPDIVSDITDAFVESDSFVFKAKDDLPIVSDVLDDAELTDVTGEPIEATAEQLKAFAAAQFMAPLTDLSEMSVMDSDTDWLTTQAQDPNYWDMVS